jgi:uncharacterized membrane protein YphA (DoxX/SURF4 family)
MFVAAAIVSVLLALIVSASGVGMLTRQPPIVESMDSVGVPDTWYPWLAICKLLGAAGLIVGLWVPAIGIAAAIGLSLYFLAAIVFHLRVGDRNIGPPLVPLLLSVAALVLLAGSI